MEIPDAAVADCHAYVVGMEEAGCVNPTHSDCPALVAARPYLMPTREEIEQLVGQAWDDGNAVGLDGYVGPNRGAGDVDPEAERCRRRMVDRVLALLSTSGDGE